MQKQCFWYWPMKESSRYWWRCLKLNETNIQKSNGFNLQSDNFSSNNRYRLNFLIWFYLYLFTPATCIARDNIHITCCVILHIGVLIEVHPLTMSISLINQRQWCEYEETLSARCELKDLNKTYMYIVREIKMFFTCYETWEKPGDHRLVSKAY